MILTETQLDQVRAALDHASYLLGSFDDTTDSDVNCVERGREALMVEPPRLISGDLMTPDQRADHVWGFVAEYRDQHSTGESMENAFIDMLTDLWHYADRGGWDMYALLKTAEMNHREEVYDAGA